MFYPSPIRVKGRHMSCFIVEAGGIYARELGEVVEVAIVFYSV